MFGLEGVAVPLGFALTILSAILCVVYGAMNWNKGFVTEDELKQESVWKAEETKVKEKL